VDLVSGKTQDFFLWDFEKNYTLKTHEEKHKCKK
jgi:hypothetical protein